MSYLKARTIINKAPFFCRETKPSMRHCAMSALNFAIRSSWWWTSTKDLPRPTNSSKRRVPPTRNPWQPIPKIFPIIPPRKAACKSLVCPHFSGGATVLHIEDIDTLFLTPHKGCELTLNNIPVKTALGLLKNEFKILADKEGLDLSLPSKAFEPEGYSHKVAKQLKARLATLVTSYRGKRKLADRKSVV